MLKMRYDQYIVSKIKRNYVLSSLALIGAYTAWGIGYPMIKISNETIPPELSIAIRYLLAALIFLPFAIKYWVQLTYRQWLYISIAGFVGAGFAGYILSLGLMYTSANNAAIIALLSPLTLVFITKRFLQEKIRLQTVLGVVVGLVGAFVALDKPWDADKVAVLGIGLLLLNIIINNAGDVFAKKVAKHTHEYQLTFLVLLIGAVPMVALSLYNFSEYDLSTVSTRSLWGTTVSLITIVIANILFYYAIRRRTLQSTGIYKYVMAMATIITAGLVLDEKITFSFLYGLGFLALGIYIAERKVTIR